MLNHRPWENLQELLDRSVEPSTLPPRPKRDQIFPVVDEIVIALQQRFLMHDEISHAVIIAPRRTIRSRQLLGIEKKFIISQDSSFHSRKEFLSRFRSLGCGLFL